MQLGKCSPSSLQQILFTTLTTDSRKTSKQKMEAGKQNESFMLCNLFHKCIYFSAHQDACSYDCDAVSIIYICQGHRPLFTRFTMQYNVIWCSIFTVHCHTEICSRYCSSWTTVFMQTVYSEQKQVSEIHPLLLST